MYICINCHLCIITITKQVKKHYFKLHIYLNFVIFASIYSLVCLVSWVAIQVKLHCPFHCDFGHDKFGK